MRSRSPLTLALLASASICAAVGCGMSPAASNSEFQQPVQEAGSGGSGVVHSPSSPAAGEGSIQEGGSGGSGVVRSPSSPAVGRGSTRDGGSVGSGGAHSPTSPRLGKGFLFNPSQDGAPSSIQTELVVPAALACEAVVPIILNRGSTTTVTGTTTGMPLNYDTYCGQTSMAPAVVYAFTVADTGTLHITLKPTDGSSLQPILDLRTDCGVDWGCESDGEFLADLAGDGFPTGTTMYFIVTGDNQTSGGYTATISLSAPTCGDGVVNVGEACDPGAAIANDGCGDPGQPDACQFQQPAPSSGDQCPGQVVSVPAGTTVLRALDGNSTYGFADDYEGSCGSPFGASDPGGADRVYQLVPAQSGTMTVSIGYETDGVTSICGTDYWNPWCWASVLYVRTTCDDTTTEIACASDNWDVDGNLFQAWTLSVPVTAGTPYYVFVDGVDNSPYSTGVFNLVISLEDSSATGS